MIKTGYTEPKLSEFGGDLTREWYVSFNFTCPLCTARKAYQLRMGINWQHTLPGRRQEGIALARMLSKHLAAGWNPHHEPWSDYLVRLQQEDEDELSKMPLSQALDWGLEKRKPFLAPKSYLDYAVVVGVAKAAAKAAALHRIEIGQVGKGHIKTLLAKMGELRQKEYDRAPRGSRLHGKTFSGNSYNKYKRVLCTVFSELEEYEAVPFNPCLRIKKREEVDTNIHRHALDRERQAIKQTLQEHHPAFYRYLLFEYHTGIRPKEILRIRICDIDWFNQAVNLRPEADATKNKAARKVPLPNVLMPYLDAMQLKNRHGQDFIFSTNFLPGEKAMHRNTATGWWKRIVKDGLGLDVSLYSFKGLGGEDKRKAGIAADAVSAQYGHSSMKTTAIYLHNEQDRVHEQIKEQTREL